MNSNRPTQGLKLNRSLRIFELVQNVSGMLEGEFDDWPANIQDAILEAAERASEASGIKMAMTFSKCDHDVDQGWYVHVVYSEIIAVVDGTTEGVLM